MLYFELASTLEQLAEQKEAEVEKDRESMSMAATGGPSAASGVGASAGAALSATNSNSSGGGDGDDHDVNSYCQRILGLLSSVSTTPVCRRYLTTVSVDNL